MIDVYFWPTPNGYKITIAHEEVGLPYEIRPVNIGRGEQFRPEFLAISPNNRMPAIVDHDPLGGGAPLSIFESGAILLYLAEKSARLCPRDVRGRYDVTQWLMWQVAGLGPMTGQANHFKRYAKDPIPYAIERYTNEMHRLYGVMERRLADREYLAGEYSVADVACWPWMTGHDALGVSFDEFPRVKRWFDAVGARPAVQRGMAVGKELRTAGLDEEARKVLFGQKATGLASGSGSKD